LYRLFFGYSITKTRLGFGSVIVVDRAQLANCSIGRFTTFIGPMTVRCEGSRIGFHNKFYCGDWTASAEFKDNNYERTFLIEPGSQITNNHYFDVAGSLSIGAGSWIAGRDSQFWTHGAGVEDRNISIGKECYVASAVRFAPGTEIAPNTVVALGSVVTGKFTRPNTMIAGVPARIVKENVDWKSNKQLT
jgi:acetyltransferase-like isoleucine patch superfamily enzyme